jgi:hypothetical protein
MLARTAASLSVITEDRIQLGLGGGAFTEAIASMGGLPRHGDQMVDTFVFWPVTDPENQLVLFASEVVPAVREAVESTRNGRA